MQLMEAVTELMNEIHAVTGIIPEPMEGEHKKYLLDSNDGFLEVTYRFFKKINLYWDYSVYLTYDKDNIKVIFSTGDIDSHTLYIEYIGDFTKNDVKPFIQRCFKNFGFISGIEF